MRLIPYSLIIWLLLIHLRAFAEAPLPWDFNPYDVRVWVAVDEPENLEIESLIKDLNENFYKTPGPAWRTSVSLPPEEVSSIIFRNFDRLKYDDIVARDPVLAMKRNHEFASSVRSVATAGEKLKEIPGHLTNIQALREAAVTIPIENWRQFLASLRFDNEGKLHIAGGAQDGSDAVIYFTDTFTARLKNAIDDDKQWYDTARRLKMTDEGELRFTNGSEEDPGMPITLDLVMGPIRKAFETNQSWNDFLTQWKLDEEDNETLRLKLPNTDFFFPLPNRVFKDFYLKQYRDDGIKKPDGAVQLDKQDEFVNQQVLIDQLRELIHIGNGWTKFVEQIVPEPKGTLYLEKSWTKEETGAMIIPRGIAMILDPEPKIIDPKVPGSVGPILSVPDKVFFAKVETSEKPYRISVRELDCPMRLMGPIIRSTSSNKKGIADAISRSAMKAFSPIVRLENVGKKIANGRVRAGGLLMIENEKGELVLDTSSPAAIKAGDLLQPVIRRIDRFGNPILLEVVDFAYLKVSERDKAKVVMDAYAGRVGTLQGRTDRRTTRIGMKIRPYLDSTVVRLHAQKEPDKPLVGYDIYQKEIDSNAMSLIGRSDWDGRIWLKKDPKNPLRLLYVKNGRSVLARLPLVPGQSELEIADIPADDIRLRAEAYLKGIENAIVDLVAIRSLLAARIRIRLEKGELDTAKELLEGLRAQPTYDVISKDMDTQSTIIKAESKFQQQTISNMFARTRKMLVEHITPRLILDLEKDVRAVENGEPMPSALKKAEEASKPKKTPAN